MQSTATRPGSERYGWAMVIVAAVFTGVGTGTLGTFSVFLKPLAVDFGWLRGDTSMAYLVGSIAMGAGGIAMGYAADRFSTRPVALTGAVAVALAALLLSTQERLWQLYLYYLLLGGLGVSAFDAPLLANVGRWFDHNKGLAIGLATAGRSLGQGLMPFGAGVLIPLLGWRSTYVAMGVFAAAVLVPLSLLVRDRPRATQGGTAAAHDAPYDPATTRHIVLWLGSAAVFCCVCMATAMVHVAAMAQDRGLPVSQAGGILLVLFAAAFFGRIAFGRLADRVGGLNAYMAASLSQTVLVFWFTQVHSLAGFILIAMLFGFGFSGVMTCVVVCIREFAPTHRTGVAQGTVLFLAWLGMGFGGWQAGYSYDLTGSYLLPFGVATAAGVINLALLLGLHAFLLRRQASDTRNQMVPVVVPQT
jgi:MFS family permease